MAGSGKSRATGPGSEGSEKDKASGGDLTGMGPENEAPATKIHREPKEYCTPLTEESLGAAPPTRSLTSAAWGLT